MKTPLQTYGEFSALHESFFVKPQFKDIQDLFSYQEPHQTRIANQLLSILMEVRGVSEKAYESQNQLKQELETLYAQHPEMANTIREFKQQGKRDAYCAEHLYHTYLQTAAGSVG